MWAYLKIQEELAASPQKFAEAYAKLTGLDPKVSAEASKAIKLGAVVSPEQIKAPGQGLRRSRRHPEGRLRRYRQVLGRLVRHERAEEMKLTADLLLDSRAGKIALGLARCRCWSSRCGRPPAPNGSLFGGVLPTPDRVWQAWKIWAFGPAGMGLNPYSGTWLDNALFSTERVAKGFGVAILFGVPLGIAIGWWRLAAGIFDPTIQVLRPVPITAWLPFSIAVFGIRDIGVDLPDRARRVLSDRDQHHARARATSTRTGSARR